MTSVHRLMIFVSLQTFIDELQPHQEKVGELVNQIETLIFSNLVAEEEAEPLQTSLESLKDLWQKVFDATSARQERSVASHRVSLPHVTSHYTEYKSHCIENL